VPTNQAEPWLSDARRAQLEQELERRRAQLLQERAGGPPWLAASLVVMYLATIIAAVHVIAA
jgi:uncharacterized protein YbaP (TraB family)